MHNTNTPCEQQLALFLHLVLMTFTFAGAVGPAEHRALLYAAERLEHLPHVDVRLLLSQHAHKQLPVF